MSVTLPASGRMLEIRPTDAERLLRLTSGTASALRELQVSRALAALVSELDASAAHALSLADRHALIRALTLVDGYSRAEAVVDCAECGERLELSLDLSEIEPTPVPRPLLVTRDSRTRECRLPTPGDLEAARDERDVIAACLGLTRDEAAEWSEATSQLLAACDPLGDVEIAGICCQCGAAVVASYDLPAAWLERLRRRADELLHDIHELASRYHWSEADILRLPPARRDAYLELCRASTEPSREVFV